MRSGSWQGLLCSSRHPSPWTTRTTSTSALWPRVRRDVDDAFHPVLSPTPPTFLSHSSRSLVRAARLAGGAAQREGCGAGGRGKGPHLLVPLDLGVDEGPQDVGGERQVRVHQLHLLVQAVQGEVVPELHRLDRVLLLQSKELPLLPAWQAVTANTLLSSGAPGLQPSLCVTATQPSDTSRGTEGSRSAAPAPGSSRARSGKAPTRQVPGHRPLCPAPGTSTMRDSSCSTDSGSRPCRAVLICLFIRVYLCRARWCLCNTPFSCRSHRSYGRQGRWDRLLLNPLTRSPARRTLPRAPGIAPGAAGPGSDPEAVTVRVGATNQNPT